MATRMIKIYEPPLIYRVRNFLFFLKKALSRSGKEIKDVVIIMRSFRKRAESSAKISVIILIFNIAALPNLTALVTAPSLLSPSISRIVEAEKIDAVAKK